MAIYFLIRLSGDEDHLYAYQEPSDLGYALAQSIQATDIEFSRPRGGDRTREIALIDAAIAQDEPHALAKGIDLTDGIQRLRMIRAAELGWEQAQAVMVSYECFPKSLYWSAKLSRYRDRNTFVEHLEESLKRPDIYQHLRVVLLAFKACTRMKQSLYDENARLCTGYSVMYHIAIAKARDACVAWVLCANRMAGGARHPICKDVRRIISKLVWRSRKEGLYLVGLI